MHNHLLRKLVIRLTVLALVMGAYGLGLQNSSSQQKEPVYRYQLDDLNKDGKVDISDLSLFTKNYPKQPKTQKVEIQL